MDDTITNLKKHLAWAIHEIEDHSTYKQYKDNTPDHSCGYQFNPDSGYCEFHEMYWESKSLIGELECY